MENSTVPVGNASESLLVMPDLPQQMTLYGFSYPIVYVTCYFARGTVHAIFFAHLLRRFAGADGSIYQVTLNVLKANIVQMPFSVFGFGTFWLDIASTLLKCSS